MTRIIFANFWLKVTFKGSRKFSVTFVLHPSTHTPVSLISLERVPWFPSPVGVITVTWGVCPPHGARARLRAPKSSKPTRYATARAILLPPRMQASRVGSGVGQGPAEADGWWRRQCLFRNGISFSPCRARRLFFEEIEPYWLARQFPPPLLTLIPPPVFGES